MRRLRFSQLPISFVQILIISSSLAYIKVIEEIVAQVLMIQVAVKAPGLKKNKFQILQLI